MTTSGVISGTLTARALCEAAAQDLGVYSAGESLSASDAADMLLRLSWMLKSWQADGVNLWRETEGQASFSAAQRTATLDPRCMDVIEARLVQSSTFLRPLQRWEIGEYRQLPNPDQPGFPTAYYLQKNVGAVSMSLWPVPSQAMTIKYTYARITEDVTDLGQTLDIPQEWMETVWTNLAVRCVPMFGAADLNSNAVQMVTARAQLLERKLLDNDRPASIFTGPVYGRSF